MGVLGYPLEHFLERLGQPAKAFQLGFVGVQLALVGQLALEDQVRHLFELAVLGQILHVVAAIGQAGAGFAHRGERGLARYLATQAGAANFLLCHRRFPLLKK